MARAIFTAGAIYVDCPHCGEGQTHPETGSYLWDATATLPESVTCQNPTCGAKLNLRAKSAQVLHTE